MRTRTIITKVVGNSVLRLFRQADPVQKRIKALEEAKNIQCRDGNWNYSPYMYGMANGLILALHLMLGDEGVPTFLDEPEKWLMDNPSKQDIFVEVGTAVEAVTG